MRKTLLILFSIFTYGFYTYAATPVKVTFEEAEIGSKGGVVSVWDAGTIEVVACFCQSVAGAKSKLHGSVL